MPTDYAIIRLGNKQHRVRDGETLVVDRLRADGTGAVRLTSGPAEKDTPAWARR